jgi:hypothetical protein
VIPSGVPGHESLGARDGLILDVGGEFGGLVLLTDAEYAGVEIEVSPVGDDHTRTHALVLERQEGTGVVHAAVYVELPQGAYTVWHPAGSRWDVATIEGGSIGRLDLRSRP